MALWSSEEEGLILMPRGTVFASEKQIFCSLNALVMLIQRRVSRSTTWGGFLGPLVLDCGSCCVCGTAGGFWDGTPVAFEEQQREGFRFLGPDEVYFVRSDFMTIEN